MSRDRVIKAKAGSPLISPELLGSFLLMYLGTIATEMTWGGSRWTITLPGPTKEKDLSSVRWIEVFVGSEVMTSGLYVSVITRHSDRITNDIADSLARRLEQWQQRWEKDPS